MVLNTGTLIFALELQCMSYITVQKFVATHINAICSCYSGKAMRLKTWQEVYAINHRSSKLNLLRGLLLSF